MVADIDVAVVAAARGGDPAALDELVTAYLPLVYNIVGRAMARHGEVDDVVQDTMLRIVRGLPDLRESGALRSWLVAVTMNRVRQRAGGQGQLGRRLDDAGLLRLTGRPVDHGVGGARAAWCARARRLPCVNHQQLPEPCAHQVPSDLFRHK